MLEEQGEQFKRTFAAHYKHTFKGAFLFLVKEKHDERYFLCLTVEDLYRAAVKIVTERHKDGMYVVEPEENVMGMTEEEVAALPEGSVKIEAVRQLAHVKRQKQDEVTAKHQWEWARHVAATKDGGVAMLLLRARNQYEYERWDILAFDEVP